MADIFQEVDEELRREKLEEFWKENGNFIIVLIVLVVLSTAATAGWRSWSYDRNVDKTGALAEAVYAEDRNVQAEALGAYMVENDGFHGALARFVAAGKLLADNKTEEAVGLYDEIAADGDVDTLYRDLALLLSIGARLDTADAAVLKQDIARLDRAGNAWRPAAQEMQALLAAREGDFDTAAGIMTKLMENSETPNSMRGRAQALASVYRSRAALAAASAATRPEGGSQDKGAVTE